MANMASVLTRWELDALQVRDRMYRAPTPRERERWHALWLLAQGWSANKVAELLERDAHTIGGGWPPSSALAPPRWPSSRPVPPPPSTRRPGRGWRY